MINVGKLLAVAVAHYGAGGLLCDGQGGGKRRSHVDTYCPDDHHLRREVVAVDGEIVDWLAANEQRSAPPRDKV